MAKIVDKEAKKQEILEAAIQVFAQKGIAGAKIHHIAKAAGVSQGTIYLYYKSKEEIFQNILQLHTQSAEPMLLRFLSPDDGPREKIRKLMLGSLHGVPLEHGALLLEMLATMIREPQRYDSISNFSGMHEVFQKVLEEGLQSGEFKEIDTQALASALTGLLHGVQILELINKEEFPAKEIMENALEVLFRGLEESSS